MATVGYARVSSIGQNLAVQLEKLEAAGCDKIFKETRSGVDAGRPELKRCLDFLREGDTLLVTKIDRLARSTTDLYRVISTLWPCWPRHSSRRAGLKQRMQHSDIS
jgi:DNA invertase Pin-like site-specific DNA recombinase